MVLLLALVVGLAESTTLYLIGAMAVSLASDASHLSLEVGGFLQINLRFLAAIVTSFSLLIGCAVMSVPLARISTQLGARALARSRARLLDAYFTAPWRDRLRMSEGRLQELAGEYCRRIEHLVIHTLNALSALVATLILALGAALAAPVLTLTTGLAFVVITYPMRAALRRVRELSGSFAERDSAAVGTISQSVRLNREIDLFDVAKPVSYEIRAKTDEAVRYLARMRSLSRLVPAEFQYAALGVATGLILVVRTTSVASAAQFGSVLLLLVRALGYLRQLQAGLQLVSEYQPYLEAVHRESERLESVGAREASSSVVDTRTGDLSLQEVHFSYGAGEPVLNNVTLAVRDGEAIGIMGPSGAGKSTLIHVIVGLLAPDAGRVCVGGIDLNGRPRLGVHLVPQENQLLRGTIADNVRFYRPSIDEDDIWSALEQAGLADFVSSLPGGLDYEVGPGAADLSGGQRQRLGIARALIGRPRVLVFDEPTSALDRDSVTKIRGCIEALRGQLTMVIVSHDETMMAHVDSVYRLHDGRLVRRVT